MGRLLCVAVMLAAILITGKPALSQAFPSRPVTIIVPFPAGGPVDTIGRIIAERMRTFLGQPVLIENVGGAAGSIGVGRASPLSSCAEGRRLAASQLPPPGVRSRCSSR